MPLPVYKRQKDGFQYTFGGLRTLKNADAFQPNKYPLATNIRSRTGNSVRTRPGLAFLFSTGAGATAVTDLRAYAALATDNRPRFLARDSLDRIWLDTGAQVGSLLAGGLGVSLIPFRPAQSPNPFMYVANAADYQKFSAPDATNAVIQHEVGITEPQSSPDAAIDTFSVDDVTGVASGWAAAGTAGAITDITRVTDIVGAAVLADPASVPPSLGTRYSVQIGAATQYQIGMRVDIGALPIRCVVEDIFPSISTGVSLSILSIFYFTGATGRCVIVPNLMPVDNSIPAFSEGDPTGGTIGMQQLIASLRRGSIIKLNLESVLVLSVSRGPSGSIAIETSTVSSHAAGETLSGVPAIAVHSGVAPTTGMTISGTALQWSNAVGLGTVTTPFTSATNPFIHLNSGDPTLPAPQQEDYVHLSINVSDLTQLSTTAPAIRIMFDVNSGAADFAANYFYFEVRANDLLAAVSGTQSQLAGAQTAAQRQGIDRSLDAGGALDSVDISPTFGTRNPAGSRQLPTAVTGTTAINTSGQTELGSSQWSEVLFPIQSLTRVGNDSTRTLANCQAVRVQLNTLGTAVIQIGSLWVGQGGGQPDVGDVGALYFYRVRPRDSRTGVVGNPSPSTRYGVNPRRQRVILSLPSAAYDSQIDTWDIFRYGGSVAAFRYIGSVASTATTYTDNVFDDAARAGDPLDFDNFEPWPSVDLPFTGTAQLVVGTLALVTIPAGFSPLRWLPGTQIILSGTQAFTLRARPTLVSGTTYLLQFIENAGTGTLIPAQINEPLLANQPGSYLWGPDSVGTIFSCGDALRPSTVSYSKQFIPDSAPDSYNQELCPPSEPLLGGDIVDGVSIVASSSRWWRLIPQFNLPQRYSAVPLPWPRGLAAPFGHCTDGEQEYWWAKDGIFGSTSGSLTDLDLYNLFPHEGVTGENVTYAGTTYFAPDYSRAGTFRLAYCDGFLYADYQDSTGTPRTLTLNLRRPLTSIMVAPATPAWCVDLYATPVTCHYAIEQQAGSVLTAGTRYAILVMGNSAGIVGQQSDLANDLGVPIPCVISTSEFGGGDVRTNDLYGDIFLDSLPNAPAGIVATPTLFGAPSGPSQTIPTASSRSQVPVSLGGGVIQSYLGLRCAWTDDFSVQAQPTELFVWQPSAIDKPEPIVDRFTDWDDAGTPMAKFVQGFILEADTLGANVNLLVRNGDSLLPVQTFAVNHATQQEKAYSFTTPFITHLMRIEPQGTPTQWRLFEVKWIFQPTPESALVWTTQATSHGLRGFQHVRQVSVSYSAIAPVSLTITAYDGTSPTVVTLPSTGATILTPVVQKRTFILTTNKGMSYTYSFTSASPFQIYEDDLEVLVGAWGRTDQYTNYPLVGGKRGDGAEV